MLLHTVNKSPLSQQTLQNCLRVLAEDDALLLIEDGVYAADNAFAELFDNAATSKLYALKADVEARGLSSRLSERFTLVDDAGFVDLVVSFAKTQSWY